MYFLENFILPIRRYLVDDLRLLIMIPVLSILTNVFFLKHYLVFYLLYFTTHSSANGAQHDLNDAKLSSFIFELHF